MNVSGLTIVNGLPDKDNNKRAFKSLNASGGITVSLFQDKFNILSRVNPSKAVESMLVSA